MNMLHGSALSSGVVPPIDRPINLTSTLGQPIGDNTCLQVLAACWLAREQG